MQITCPHCGFSKAVDAARIPAGTLRVACPGCGERFPFVPADEALPEAGSAALPGPEAPQGQVGVAGSAPSAEAAGFWVRVVALMVDGVVVTILQLLLSIVFGLSAAGMLGGGEDDVLLVLAVTWLFSSTLAAAYYVFFTGYCGQTPGKMALRLKVLRCDGSEVGFGRAFLREIPGKFLSSVLLGLGYLMVAFDARKQGLHDRIAGTCVIKLP